MPRHATEATTTENVHGPSFLGLAEDPKVEFHYLYEDEQPRSHVGLVLLLAIILGGGGYLGWQWRHNGFPFNRLSAASGVGAAPSADAAPTTTAPNQETSSDKPATGTTEVQPTPSEDKPQAEQAAKPKQTQGANENSAAGSDSGQKQASTGDQPAPSAEKGAPAEATEEAKATPPPRLRERSSQAKTPLARERALKPAAEPETSVRTSPDADLELAGEKYLYGNGVPQNCARAESSLRTAATRGNSKAQTVLGTMYATGHCVGRDLPTAYRWFARALHQEPQNSRISADLQVLWHQMTPQEQQLATSSR
jgi:cytoskeletal protein RodZ